ncbi:MAG TPA: 4-hydroxy-3-methylbut-2-en-1-yl diphosphate synthase, partial [Clostridiales bacterium]|nr:4-hydroxy-3-methylbut-2-en-1-yl diphosphate synthase [Clostridiales bacterium]
MAGHKHVVKIGSVCIGGEYPIAIQSMTNSKTTDVKATLQQIHSLEKAGCDIVRFTVPDREAVKAIGKIRENTAMPLVADIHFNPRLAVEAAAAGVDKIRINPGNIGSQEGIRNVVKACREHGLPVRIGVNGGSLEKHILAKHGGVTPHALAESALYHASLLEKFDFTDIVLSVKSSSVATTIQANRILAEQSPYPLHLGVTEAGTPRMGILKSAVGIGSLLCDGIGNTIRVSLTAPVEDEVAAAKALLEVCGLKQGIEVVSCPTCGRTEIDLVKIVNQLQDILERECVKPSRRYKI